MLNVCHLNSFVMHAGCIGKIKNNPTNFILWDYFFILYDKIDNVLDKYMLIFETFHNKNYLIERKDDFLLLISKEKMLAFQSKNILGFSDIGVYSIVSKKNAFDFIEKLAHLIYSEKIAKTTNLIWTSQWPFGYKIFNTSFSQLPAFSNFQYWNEQKDNQCENITELIAKFIHYQDWVDISFFDSNEEESTLIYLT